MGSWKCIDEVDIGEIRRQQEVGRGAFGKVMKGDWKGVAVAVKIFHKSQADDGFWKEVGQLRFHSHPNVISIYAVCTNRRAELAYVMEYAPGGSLQHRMESPYTNKEALNWARQGACGIAYLHSDGIMHRDLKPGNLLLFPGDVLKLGDFGLVTTVRAHMTCAGTLQYMAPEVFQNTGEYCEKADVYSFGVILYQLYARALPKCCGLQMPPMGNCSKLISDLTHSCCRRKPEQRPTMQQVHDQLMQEVGMASSRIEILKVMKNVFPF